MKKVYKIYCFGLATDKYLVEYQNRLISSPVACPDFETEQDAENWLIGQKFPPAKGVEMYFFVAKTFKIEAIK